MGDLHALFRDAQHPLLRSPCRAEGRNRQHFAGRVGNPMDIANMVLFLASDKAGFITGENICIDGGMTRNMIYHNDFGWRLEKS